MPAHGSQPHSGSVGLLRRRPRRRLPEMLWWSEERKLERRLTHVQRVARKLIRQTEAKKSREEGELQGVLQECSEAEAMAMDELNSVSSQNLLHGARRLGIAAPEFNKEAYQEGYTPGFHYLTAA